MASNVTELLVEIGSRFDGKGFRSATDAIKEQRQQMQLMNAEERLRSAQAQVRLRSEAAEAAKRQVILRGSHADIRASMAAQEQLTLAQNRAAAAAKSLDITNESIALSSSRSAAGVGILTSAIGIGLVGALAAATAGGALFFNQFKQGIATESDRLADLNAYMRATGETLAQSQTATAAIRRSAAIAGRDLPVEARNIQRAQSSIIDDLAKYSRGADLQKSLLNIGTGSALAAQSSQLQIQDANLLNNKLLAGASLGGLNQLALYERESGVRTALEASFAKRGITSTAQISGAERAKLLEEVYTAAFPEDAIERMRGTAQARISEFTDNLFDPEVGIFSFSRALKDGRSVFDSGKRTLELIIGSNGIFGQLARLAGFSAGGAGDPLENIQNAIDGFNQYLEGVVSGLTKLKNLGGAEVGGMIGKLSADITDGLISGLVGAIVGINWGQVAIGLVVGIASYFANLDWSTYAVGALALIGAAFIPGLVSAVGTFLVGLAGVIISVVGGVPLLIGAAIVLGVVAIVKLISDNWTAITTTVTGVWNAFWKVSTEAGQSLISNVTGIINAIVDAVTGWFRGIQNTVAGLFGGQVQNQPRVQSSVIPASVSAATSASPARVSSNPVNARFASRFENRFMGQVPTAAAGFPSGIMEALAREMAAAPGTTPVIANSGEFIIPRDKAAGILAAGGSRSNITVSVGNIIVQGAESARETAELVKAIILNEVKQELEAIA